MRSVRALHGLRGAALLGSRPARRAAPPRSHRRRPAHRSVAGRKCDALSVGGGSRSFAVRAVPRSPRQHRPHDVSARRISLRRRRPVDRDRRPRRCGLARARRRNRRGRTDRVAQRRRWGTSRLGGRHRRSDFTVDHRPERCRTREAPATHRSSGARGGKCGHRERRRAARAA